MPRYRLLFLDDQQNLLWGRDVECSTDDQAIEMARREEGGHLAVQIWDGERMVCLVGNPRGPAATSALSTTSYSGAQPERGPSMRGCPDNGR
jgi:hypothetical protein